MSLRLGLVLLLAAFAQASDNDTAVPAKDQVFLLNKEAESRIINGKDAAYRQFPYQVGMFMDKSSFCGGAVISEFWVLTAAHCVDKVQLHTIFFAALEMNLPYENHRLVLNTRTSYAHEDYNPQGLRNDIAVIKMPVKVKLDQNVKVMPLPPRSFEKQNFVGEKVRVSGWGKLSDANRWISAKLQYVDLTVIENDECAKYYGDTITDKIVCAAGPNNKSTCNGDSGGPLVIVDKKSKKNVHFGVVSFVHRDGCASGKPSGYDRTYKYLDWINEKTKIPIKN